MGTRAKRCLSYESAAIVFGFDDDGCRGYADLDDDAGR